MRIVSVDQNRPVRTSELNVSEVERPPYLWVMRGRGGQDSSCLNWWVLRTSPLKFTSQIREPGRAQYSSAG